MEKEKVIKDADDDNPIDRWIWFKEIMLRRNSRIRTRPTNIGKFDGRVSEDMVNHPSRYMAKGKERYRGHPHTKVP